MSIELSIEEHDAQEKFFRWGWTDGLPVVPSADAPTVHHVTAS
jgi:hypothetical protein